jgi:type VI secretion system secreted protein VgrG
VRAINEVTGDPIAQMPYKLQTAEGEVYFGTTDDEGKTIQVKTISQQGIKVWWGAVPSLREEIT